MIEKIIKKKREERNVYLVTLRRFNLVCNRKKSLKMIAFRTESASIICPYKID